MKLSRQAVEMKLTQRVRRLAEFVRVSCTAVRSAINGWRWQGVHSEGHTEGRGIKVAGELAGGDHAVN